MIPGVRYFPVPSIVTASAGAVTLAPTSRIFPSSRSTAPLRIAGPAAVSIVTFRITVGRDAKGRYVLGNGFALGTDRPPWSETAVVRAALSTRGAGAESARCDAAAAAGVGELWVVRAADEQATPAINPIPTGRNLMRKRVLRGWSDFDERDGKVESASGIGQSESGASRHASEDPHIVAA